MDDLAPEANNSDSAAAPVREAAHGRMRSRRKFIITKTVQAQFRNIDQANALAILRKLDRFERTGIDDVKKLVDIHPPEPLGDALRKLHIHSSVREIRRRREKP